MSEEAVWQRLRQVDQLHELCLSLSRTKPLSKDEAIELRRSHAPPRRSRQSKQDAKEEHMNDYVYPKDLLAEAPVTKNTETGKAEADDYAAEQKRTLPTAAPKPPAKP